MLVEVQYRDQDGSVCPFCGGDVFSHTDYKHEFEHETTFIRVFPVRCDNHHLSFMSITVDTLQDGYDRLYTARQYVHYQDWEQHIDMVIPIGAWETPLLDNEDDAWAIHLTALDALNNLPDSKEYDNE